MLAMKLCCQHCDAIVEHDETQMTSCLCDPDAPTWIAITREGRIMSMSHASYEYLPQPRPCDLPKAQP